jgi:tripartite-type tricarboxylate transporter receptor subunit TctC
METFDKVYAEAFGKPPSGPKWDAFFLLNDISAKMQRGIFMPKGSPPEAVEAMRAGVAAVAKDPDFISDYKRVTGEEPDLLKASEVEPLFERMRRIDPQMKQILKESIGTE